MNSRPPSRLRRSGDHPATASDPPGPDSDSGTDDHDTGSELTVTVLRALGLRPSGFAASGFAAFQCPAKFSGPMPSVHSLSTFESDSAQRVQRLPAACQTDQLESAVANPGR
jgi:hypothetical protein